MTIRILRSLKEIDKKDYQPFEQQNYPFCDYDFLDSLEVAACLGERTGFDPHYLVFDHKGRPMAFAIAYLRHNSYGEYVFDFAFADAYHRHGLPYYPKITLAIPFTPATHPKILFHPELTNLERIKALEEIVAALKSISASSIHYLFSEAGNPFAESGGSFIERYSLQFHWRQNGYQSFSDYLAALKGKKRRSVTKDRLTLAEQGIEISVMSGNAIPPDAGLRFYPFYLKTIEKKQGFSYLTFDFFKQVFSRMPERILYIEAKRKDELVGASLSFYKGSYLFGRYAGTKEGFPGLHFELCYYQLIEFAIKNGLEKIEAGAQGPHKHARGFEAELLKSYHFFHEQAFHEAIRSFIFEEKNELIRSYIELTQHSAFKKINQLTLPLPFNPP